MLSTKIRSALSNSEPPLGAWDLAYAYHDQYQPSAAWDISNINISRRISVTAQETTPTSVFFKPDGTRMYVIGNAGDDVNEYVLSAAWDINTASFVQVFSISGQETMPQGISFKPDGTRMYVTGTIGDDVNEYVLSTAWDISTASFVQVFSVAAQETGPSSISFKPDGTRMYVIGSASDNVNEYVLSTAWDISTASYVRAFSVNAQQTSPQGVFFKPDGTRMYVVGTLNFIHEYSLSTAWDVSTVSYVRVTSIIASQDIFFKPDGTVLYIVVQTSGEIIQYFLGEVFSVADQEAQPEGLFFKPDGTRMYVLGSSGDDVSEYSLSTAWDINTASYVRAFSVASQDITPRDLFFKPDGTRMYVLGDTGDDVNEYVLSTAWNISTASFVQVFLVSGQDTVPRGIYFKPDGTRMYVVGQGNDSVYEYVLSTAWNISTASYVRAFLVAVQEARPESLFFKPDGTRMYVLGNSGDDVNEYVLSTAWNISTASFVQVFSVAVQDSSPLGIFFKPDGTRMYVIGNSNDRIYTYTIGIRE